MNMQLIIRAEQKGDQQEIAQILRQAFGSDDEVTLVDRLRESGIPLLSLVAETEGHLVGHILFSPVTLSGALTTIAIAGLAPMAVLPPWQNKGIGSKLVEAGLEECTKAGYDAVVVLGHSGFYPRFGFTPSVAYNIQSEYDIPAEVFMIKPLKEKSLADCSGTIKYHQAFNEL
jgi:putative acetyltransferase